MCGIIGAVLPNGDVASGSPALRSALAALAHRGPDGEGVYARDNVVLGHRRLSIIDLSDAGAQPMADSATGVAVTFNGEIFNYLELKAELRALGHCFRSGSDTEVLLRAYLEWGVECMRRFNGMFAFACYDPRQGRLLLARDRFGVKPLYYSLGRESLAFASEPEALVVSGASSGKVRQEAVKHFLLAGRYAAGESSFYDDISSLPGGHYLAYDTRFHRSEVRRYWDYPRSVANNRTREEVFEEFSDLFEDAVRLRLRSDVPLGVSLSGGLDSTAILAAAARINGEAPVCFTSTYGQLGEGEYNWAALAADRANATLVACPAPEEAWLSTLQHCIPHLGGPVATPAVVPLWHLTRAVKDAGITVALEGQGADELLGGYVQYSVADFMQRVRNPLVLPESLDRLSSLFLTFSAKSVGYTVLKEYVPGAIRALRAANGYNSMLADWVVEDGRDDIYFARRLSDNRRGLDHRLWQDHSDVQLARLLHYGDAISMANSIESRMPFMDFRLVEWVFSLPDNQRIESTDTKWMVREYLRRNGHVGIAARRDKQGYPTPFTHWLAADATRDLFADAPAGSAIFEYVDKQNLLNALERQVGGAESRANLLFRIVTLHLWLEHASARARQVEEKGEAPLIPRCEPSMADSSQSFVAETTGSLALDTLAEAASGSRGILVQARGLLEANSQLFWHSISYVGNRGFPFLAAFAAARILNVPQFGEFVAATTLFSTLVLFSDLGFSLATTTRVARNADDAPAVSRTMIASGLICAFLGLVISAGMMLGSGLIDKYAFPNVHMRSYVLAGALYVPSAALASVLAGGFAGVQSYRSLAGIGALSGLAYVGFVVTGSVMYGALAAVWGAAFAMLLRATLSFFAARRQIMRRNLRAPWHRIFGEVRDLSAIALPASLAAFAWMPTNSLIIALLMRGGGSREVAGFGAAMQIFSIVSVFPSILTQFALPRLSHAFDGDASRRKSTALKYCLAATLLSSVLATAIIFTAPILIGSFGRQYAPYRDVLATLMICAILSAPQGVLSNYLLAVGRNWTRVLTWYAWSAVVVLGLFCSSTKSAHSAAIAFTIGWGFLVVVQAIAVVLHREDSDAAT